MYQPQLITHKGQQWITAYDLGRLLGYDPINAKRIVGFIYEAHASAFGPQKTCIVTNSHGLQFRVFNHSGLVTVTHHSQSPHTSAVREWSRHHLIAQPCFA